MIPYSAAASILTRLTALSWYGALGLMMSTLVVPPPVSAEIYTWKDEKGRVQFSDTRPNGAESTQIEVDVDNNTYSPVPLPQSILTPKPQKEDRDKLVRTAQRGEVIMYSTEWCGYCARARDYFRKRGIAFKEYDIEKSTKAKKEHTALGGGGVPLLLIGTKNGTKLMRGFSESRFNGIYDQT